MLAGADGDCVRVFFFNRLTREVEVAGGGLVMIGDAWMIVVFRVQSCVVLECLEESTLMVVTSPSTSPDRAVVRKLASVLLVSLEAGAG